MFFNPVSVQLISVASYTELNPASTGVIWVSGFIVILWGLFGRALLDSVGCQMRKRKMINSVDLGFNSKSN